MSSRYNPLLFITMLLLAGSIATAQPDTNGVGSAADTATVGTGGATRPWYDTLQITRPRYARASAFERLALAAFTAISLPAGLAIGGVTLLPPSVSVLVEGEDIYPGIAVSTGLGFGGDTASTIFFPDYRVQLEAAYYFSRIQPPMVRGAILFDKPIGSIHSRDFFWFGVAGGGGVATDFKSVSPYAEGWIGVMNPMGIRFLSLFPMHNYGIRGRAGYDFATKRPWYEVSLSATSTFW